MKLKGLFFYGYDNAGTHFANPGADKKVAAQMMVLEQSGMLCKRIQSSGNYSKSLWRRIRVRMPFGSPIGDFMTCYRDEFDGYDFYYIRCTAFLSLPRLLSIRKLRKHNPSAKILYELCTYPYRKDYTRRWFDFPFLIRDICYLPFLTRCIDRFVTVSHHDIIAGVPAIKMINGIDLSKIYPASPLPEDGSIHVIAVAKISPWHGFDRFIRGMAAYYKRGGRRSVVFHIVGEGHDKSSLEAMIAAFDIEDRVVMHGFKTGKELDMLYDMSHLGLISLATQDKDIFVHSTLKSREYMAKGLPTISTGITDVFINADYKYNLELSAEERIVDLEKIIAFYDSIYSGTPRQKVISEIRSFAERNIDIHATMQPVIDYLKS